jgi:hypothetical protein
MCGMAREGQGVCVCWNMQCMVMLLHGELAEEQTCAASCCSCPVILRQQSKPVAPCLWHPALPRTRLLCALQVVKRLQIYTHQLLFFLVDIAAVCTATHSAACCRARSAVRRLPTCASHCCSCLVAPGTSEALWLQHLTAMCCAFLLCCMVQGKISREEVADLCILLLQLPSATGTSEAPWLQHLTALCCAVLCCCAACCRARSVVKRLQTCASRCCSYQAPLAPPSKSSRPYPSANRGPQRRQQQQGIGHQSWVRQG